MGDNGTLLLLLLLLSFGYQKQALSVASPLRSTRSHVTIIPFWREKEGQSTFITLLLLWKAK
jgi:hypothetical protein